MSEVAGIVLAAGSSSRMNGLLKAMLPINGKPMLRCVVESALKSSLDRVVVVLGNAFETISRVFPITGAEVVFNPEFLTGQSSSLRAGLLALGKSCDRGALHLGRSAVGRLFRHRCRGRKVQRNTHADRCAQSPG